MSFNTEKRRTNDCPLVSVYIPTYNRLRLLKRAISSVLNQSYINIELLIVDDGSSDGTCDYLEALAKTESRVVILKKTGRRGAPASRNIAIFNAKGKYITGLDDDDFFCEGHISNLLNNYDSSLSCCFVRKQNYKDRFLSPIAFMTRRVGFYQLAHFNIIGNQVFTETWKIRQIKGFDEKLMAAQDYDTWLVLLKNFGLAKLVYSDTYRVDVSHGGQRITENVQKKISAYKYICDKHDFNSVPSVARSFDLRCNLLACDFSRLPALAILDPKNSRYLKRVFSCAWYFYGLKKG
jgi:glycosyltransferase involved in cell wall biosynthesis